MNKLLSGTGIFYSLLIMLLPMTLILCLDQGVNAAEKAAYTGGIHSEVLRGIVSQNELVDNLERLGIKCFVQEGKVDSLVVSTVHLGSSAYYEGVLAGDIIKDLHKLSANTFSLRIQRAGRIYQVNVQTLSGQLAEMNPLNVAVKKDLLKGNIDSLSAAADAKKTELASTIPKLIIPGSIDKSNNETTKKLLPYDIELIIDITGSMGWVDGTGDLTKFQWCHEQVRSLAHQLAPYHKTLTITTFNTSYQTTKGCTPDKVEQIYATIEPSGGTDLVDPLMDRLNDALETHRSGGRPVLVVVITDGLPNVPPDPRVVNRALINFTHRLSSPEQVIVTILQIGDTFEGRDFCVDLDDNLVNEGAKYDIVDTKTFAELKQEGLINAMIDAVVEAHNNRNLSKQEKHLKRFMKNLPSPSSKATDDAELKSRQSERQTIEQQILGQ